MGYLSQRKKSERENIFLKISATVFAFLTLCSFTSLEEIFPDLLFHFYFLNFAVLIYAFYIGRFVYGGVFLVFLVINFFHISAFANIVFNDKANPEHHMALEYTADYNKDLVDTGALVLRSGYLDFGNKSQARYWVMEKNNHAFNLIRVDFSNSLSSVRSQNFHQLSMFIETLDDPVIIYGDFGEPAWSANMRDFLQKTGLKVKNRLVFATQKSSFNPFSLPTFYVLGFSNLGIDSLHVNTSTGNTFPVITMLLCFD